MILPWQTSDLHPHALSLDEDALLIPDFAKALASDLAAFNPPDIIHRYRITAPHFAQTETLKGHGFTATRMTRIIDLPLDVVKSTVPNPYTRHWFKLGERGPWTQWLDAHWRHYQITHRSNPPRMPAKGLKSVFIGTDLIEALAIRSGPQGRVRSFASLRENQELGWIGGRAELLKPTLATALRRATAIGWTHATLEVDDDDTALWALVQEIAPTGGQTFITWHKERDPAKGPN